MSRWIPTQETLLRTMLLLGLPLLVLGKTLGFEYVWDDPFVFSGLEHALRTGQVGDLFSTPYWQIIGDKSSPYFRPLFMMAMIPDLSLGHQAWISHAINLGLHLINIFLVFRLCLFLFSQRNLALFLSLLWGLHPVVSEPVTFVSARESLLQGICLLGGLNMLAIYSKTHRLRFYGFALVLSVLLLGMKEIAVSTFLLFPMFFWISVDTSWKRKIVFTLPFLIFLSTYLFFYRFIVLTKMSSSPSSDLSSVIHAFFTWPFHLMDIVQRLLLPTHLYSDYQASTISMAPALGWVFLAVFILLLLILLGFLFRKRPISFFAFFFLLPILPPLVLIHKVETFADRYLYLSALGLFFLLAEIIRKKRWAVSRFVRAGLASLLILTLSFVTFLDAEAWRNDRALYDDMLEGNPGSIHGHIGKAQVLMKAGEFEQAIQHYREVLDHRPGHPHALFNLAQARVEFGENQEALRLLNKGLRNRPWSMEGSQVCVRIYLTLNRPEKAKPCLDRLQELRPYALSTSTLLASLRALQGRPEMAEKHLLERWNEGQADAEYLYNLVQIQKRNQNYRGASKTLGKLIHVYPKASYYNDLGLSLYLSGDREEACKTFRAARKKYPENALLAENTEAIACH